MMTHLCRPCSLLLTLGDVVLAAFPPSSSLLKLQVFKYRAYPWNSTYRHVVCTILRKGCFDEGMGDYWGLGLFPRPRQFSEVFSPYGPDGQRVHIWNRRKSTTGGHSHKRHKANGVNYSLGVRHHCPADTGINWSYKERKVLRQYYMMIIKTCHICIIYLVLTIALLTGPLFLVTKFYWDNGFSTPRPCRAGGGLSGRHATRQRSVTEQYHYPWGTGWLSLAMLCTS